MTRSRAFLIAAVVIIAGGTAYGAGNSPVSVSATIIGKGTCSISGTTPVTFPPLDPMNPVNVTTSGSQNGTVNIQCKGLGSKGTAFSVSLVTPTPLTLKHTSPVTSDVIPYTLFLPVSGTVLGPGNNDATVQVAAQVVGGAYASAPGGTYSDTVTIQVAP